MAGILNQPLLQQALGASCAWYEIHGNHALVIALYPRQIVVSVKIPVLRIVQLPDEQDRIDLCVNRLRETQQLPEVQS